MLPGMASTYVRLGAAVHPRRESKSHGSGNIQGDQKVSVHLMITTQITPLSQHTSFLPYYLAQSDCLAADRQGQGDTGLTLTPSVIPNSNYFIMVSE
jgi:hypothetical protein